MSTTNSLPADAVFELLSNPRRRFIISYLQRHDDPVDIKHLARRIAAMENDVPLDEVTDTQEKRVHVSLYQTHVPKLADAGVLVHDQDRGIVTRSDGIRDVERYIPKRDEGWDRWPVVYTAIAAVGFGVYLASLVGVGALAQVSTELIVTLLFVAFAVVVTAQLLADAMSTAPGPFDFFEQPYEGEQ